jgi:general secretion pathway protein I
VSARTHAERGFTLLEVIVAVVIAALCLAALSQVFATGVRAAGTSSDYMQAMTLAQSKLAGVGVDKPATDGSESGTSPDGRFVWTVTVDSEPTEDADNPVRPPLELKRITARVTVAAPGGISTAPARTVQLATLLAVPRLLP